jgi:hypothetical protein
MQTSFWFRARRIVAFLASAISFRAPHEERAPIFIVGCGHSGTSILLRIMGAHSKIHAIRHETSLAAATRAQRMLRQFDVEACLHGKSRWIEKTPSHIHQIQKLLSLRKGVMILLIVRDGRDVAWSIKEREGDIGNGIERWIKDNGAGEPFWTHPQVHVLRYEDLVSEPELTISNVTAFLGESFEPAMLDYHEEPKNFYSTSSQRPPRRSGEFHCQFRNWQINQPLFDGRKRWVLLNESDKLVIKTKAGEMLSRYGYGTESDW